VTHDISEALPGIVAERWLRADDHSYAFRDLSWGNALS
jgi:hypothetical protein